VTPQTAIFTDISKGTLANVSWVIPDQNESDRPGTPSDTGPSWVASVVNAIGQSSYWNSTAIVIVWDDWGGFYDPVKPPHLDHQGGPGFRVPMIVVSPYAKRHHVSHVPYEFGSLLKYVESTFGLPSLDRTDARARNLADCFDYGQPPRDYVPLATEREASDFIGRPPNSRPPDDY